MSGDEKEEGKGRKRMKWESREGFKRFHIYRRNENRVLIAINDNPDESIPITLLSLTLYHSHNPFIPFPIPNQFNTPLKNTNSRFYASFSELKTIISLRIPLQE